MFSSLLAAATLAIAPLPASTPRPVITYDTQRKKIQYPLVNQVRCRTGSGTAFRIGPTRFLSVAHVTTLGRCTIDGWPIKVIESDVPNDFSIVEAGPPKFGAFRLNCDGFKAGQWYWSTGYAFSLPYQTNVAIFATIYHAPDNGQRILTGNYTVIPGMSGGPVINAAGEVVGTINMFAPLFGLSFSRELKDTSVCKVK